MRKYTQYVLTIKHNFRFVCLFQVGNLQNDVYGTLTGR